MGVPGLAWANTCLTVVGSVALRAGSSAAEAAIGTAGTAVGVTQAVAGPFVAVGRTTLGALAGGTAGRDASVKWSAGRRLHLELDAISPQWAEYPQAIEDVVGALPGVAAAHVEGLLGRLVVDRVEDQISAEEIASAAREAVAAAEAGATGSAGEATKTVPVADPGDWLGVVVPATAAVLDVAAVATAVIGRLTQVPAIPRAARAASALISHQPRVVTMLEQRLGRVATDLLLTAAGSATHGLGQAPGAPLLDLVQRAAQVAEALAYRDTWTAREPVLAAPGRPQIPVVAVQSSAGSAPPRHRWAAAAAGETSHVMVDAAVDIALSQAAGGGDAVEDYAEQSANGSLVAAAGALIGGGRVDDVADAVLAGVPKAAHLGRESFAAALGRGLARSGLLVLDPSALRRLDRVRVVVIDGAALRGDARAVLQACATAPGFDEDRIYEIADALLHRETVPEPDPDELPAADAELRWREPHPGNRRRAWRTPR